MDNLLWLLPLLVGMVLMMWLMGKGMSYGRGADDASESAPSIDQLRAEQERLAAQIAALEREDADRAGAQSQPNGRTRASAPSG